MANLVPLQEKHPLVSSGSSADTPRSRTPVQDIELERGIVRTCPRVCAEAFRQTALCTISACTVWVPARSREKRSTTVFSEMIANRKNILNAVRTVDLPDPLGPTKAV
jgi:hypothetical protein